MFMSVVLFFSMCIRCIPHLLFVYIYVFTTYSFGTFMNTVLYTYFFIEVGKKHLRIYKSISTFHLTHMRNRVRDHPAMIPRITRHSTNSDAKNSEFIVRCVSSRRPERECLFTR